MSKPCQEVVNKSKQCQNVVNMSKHCQDVVNMSKQCQEVVTMHFGCYKNWRIMVGPFNFLLSLKIDVLKFYRGPLEFKLSQVTCLYEKLKSILIGITSHPSSFCTLLNKRAWGGGGGIIGSHVELSWPYFHCWLWFSGEGKQYEKILQMCRGLHQHHVVRGSGENFNDI